MKVAILVDGGFYRKRATVWKVQEKNADGSIVKRNKTAEVEDSLNEHIDGLRSPGGQFARNDYVK